MSAHRTDGDTQPAFRPLESLTVLAVIGVLGLALGLIALARPTTTAQVHKLAYTQAGTFSYSAAAPAGSVYGSGGLSSGEPILTKIVGPVHVGFDYRLSADVPSNVHGTAALGLTVDLGQGLSKTFPITSAQPFTGNHASVSGTLPLAAIESYVNVANHDLGGGGAPNAIVKLVPEIKVSGTVGGRGLPQTSYAPVLPLTVSGTTLTLSSPSGGANSATSASSSLKPSSTGTINYRASEPNTVPLLFLHPTVTSSRIAGFGVAALCLLLCLWFARPLRSGRSPADRDRINAMYGSQLMPVTGIASHDGPIVDVAGIESLAELAKKYESMIMRLAERDADVYLVWDNGILYRYRAPHEAPATDPEPRGNARTELDSTQVLPRLDADDDDLTLDVEQLLLGDVGGVLTASRDRGSRSVFPSM